MLRAAASVHHGIATASHLGGPPAIAQPSTRETDNTLVRGFARDLKAACDDLYDEPFNPGARETVLRLLNASGIADAAYARLHSTPLRINP